MKQQITAFIQPSVMKDVEINMKTINCKSKSRYVEQAVEFYNGYLHSKNNEDYVSSVIISSINGIMKGYEDRTSRMMFKQAVEMAKVFKFLAEGFKLTDEQMDSIHTECVQEVRKINGSLMYPMKSEKKDE